MNWKNRSLTTIKASPGLQNNIARAGPRGEPQLNWKNRSFSTTETSPGSHNNFGQRSSKPASMTVINPFLYQIQQPVLFYLSDVGFKVGGTTKIKYVVLQVHYADVTKFKGESSKASQTFYLTYLVINDIFSFPPATRRLSFSISSA